MGICISCMWLGLSAKEQTTVLNFLLALFALFYLPSLKHILLIIFVIFFSITVQTGDQSFCQPKIKKPEELDFVHKIDEM